MVYFYYIYLKQIRVRAILPLAGIIFVLIAAVVAASTIVLSLIPVYIPQKAATKGKKSVINFFILFSNSWCLANPNYYLVINFNPDRPMADGTLDSTASNLFARRVKIFLTLIKARFSSLSTFIYILDWTSTWPSCWFDTSTICSCCDTTE